ncbi:TetR/AcrR family transcriptional regulator [Nocardioides rubriscoriae]|uniref:TetR/AcrR family transcriptional regulator n=1 Tax=Nocardioides rubriscoriae TaxID=642762 RepID=UPI0011DFDCCF|nr:TetR/AcrR family transcriptional regulator [Nocardioides rubriscoriae]
MPETRLAGRTPAEQDDVRRHLLAESALRTLGEVGYARTSLAAVADDARLDRDTVRRLFPDEIALVVYSVRLYKARCVTRYDVVVEESTSPDELLDGFAATLVETLCDEAPMHRLWYDLRAQTMFEERLREPATQVDATLQDMVWRVVARYAELSDRPPALSPRAAYAVLDGVFQQALLAHQAGDGAAAQEVLDVLAVQVHDLMPMMLAPARDPG